MNDVQRMVTVMYYFTSEKVTQEDKLTETLDKFMIQYPDMPLYPSLEQLKSFIDSLIELKTYPPVFRANEDKSSRLVNCRKRIDTKENWKKVKAVLIQNRKTPIQSISQQCKLTPSMGKFFFPFRFLPFQSFSRQNDANTWLQNGLLGGA